MLTSVVSCHELCEFHKRVRINGLFHLLMGYIGIITHLLTLGPMGCNLFLNMVYWHFSPLPIQPDIEKASWLGFHAPKFEVQDDLFHPEGWCWQCDHLPKLGFFFLKGVAPGYPGASNSTVFFNSPKRLVFSYGNSEVLEGSFNYQLGGIKQAANAWWFWGLSLIIVFFLGWYFIMTPVLFRESRSVKDRPTSSWTWELSLRVMCLKITRANCSSLFGTPVQCSPKNNTWVSVEVSNYLVSWVITFLGHLQPTYIGVIIQLLYRGHPSRSSFFLFDGLWNR